MIHLALNNSITDVRLLQWSEVFILYQLRESKNCKKIIVDRKKNSENYTAYQTPNFGEHEPNLDFLLTNRRLHTHTHIYSSMGSQWGNTVSN